MNKLIAIILFSFILFNLFAEKDVTVEVFPHYVSHIGIRTAIPIKVTYTISDDKAVYMPGDEVIIDCIFEYVPEDKYNGFDPKLIYLVDFQRTLYEYNYSKKISPSKENTDYTILGEEAFILTYKNRVHKMKIKINYHRRTLTDLFLTYELDRYSVNEIDMAISRTKKIPDGVRRVLPERVYGLWGKNRINKDIRIKFLEEERLNDIKQQKEKKIKK